MNVWQSVLRWVEDEDEFDPTTVTPGVEGFMMTALLAAAVIGLGFLLVSRLRRSAYRAEIREQIDRELSEQGAVGESSAGAVSDDRPHKDASNGPQTDTGDGPRAD